MADEGKTTEHESEPPAFELPLPGINDPEGETVPETGLPVIDAHVHLFPDALFAAVWQWFDTYAWPIRYPLGADAIVRFLQSRGIAHMVALQYAHRPGIANELNRFMADICERYDHVTGMATVFPGEENATAILEEAFDLGLKGVKLHNHVQCFEINGADMSNVYDVCAANGKPLIMHVGREPKSPAYPCDPYVLCSAERVERVLQAHPSLKLCVPHMGADEFDRYCDMVARYDNLWVDTTMVFADYLPMAVPPDLSRWRHDRLIFGTDFPNIPYAWDREIQRVLAISLPARYRRGIFYANAATLYGIDLPQ